MQEKVQVIKEVIVMGQVPKAKQDHVFVGQETLNKEGTLSRLRMLKLQSQ
jgi:hypothetical protein